MLAIISPAKTLDYKTLIPEFETTKPDLLSKSEELIKICHQLSPAQISSLMSISDNLAGLNAARFGEWQIEHHSNNSRPAVYAFKGDVYVGLDVESLSERDIGFAQQHLRILSGLYGLLRPLDLIQPYRLEMGTRLQNSKGKDLYAFWGNIITQCLQRELEQQSDRCLINLASDEYYKAIKTEELQARIIKPIFLDNKSGQYKVVSFYAKKARGMMCLFLIQNRLTKVEQLQEFDLGGYWFDKNVSSDNEWVFKRDLSE